MSISILSFVIYFFADLNFYDVVNNRYQQAASLAAFLGMFYGILNGLNLVLDFALAGRVLKRFVNDRDASTNSLHGMRL